MDLFFCTRCQARVHLQAEACPRCEAALGFVPAQASLLAFRAPAQPAEPWPTWQTGPSWGQPPRRLRPCANRLAHGVCNWMLDAGDASTLCRSCRLTTMIPDLSRPANLSRWRGLEAAKRQALLSLARMGLALDGSEAGASVSAPQFRFIEHGPDTAASITSHADGVITIDLAEADEMHRTQQRLLFGEPQRTLLGHLRHELGHYLQYRFVREPALQDLCRDSFGDERQDYQQALARHHDQGPPCNWAEAYISAYASAHPLEDWAETCAHLIMVWEAVHTAMAWHLRLGEGQHQMAPPNRLMLQWPSADRLFSTYWLPLASCLDAMCSSLGLSAAYPYAPSPRVLRKLDAVQKILVMAAAPVP